MPLSITVSGRELFDPNTNEIFYVKNQTYLLEHSLISISKWESLYHRSFLNDGPKDAEETLAYIRMMVINGQMDELTSKCLSTENLKTITEYIQNPMTATTISNRRPHEGASKRKEIVTSELIYYWMIALSIPQEYQKWHLNRLLTLIQVCNIKNQGDSNKSTKADTARYYNDMRARNRAKLHKK